jgi:predicted naringenin-chalcone synthase
MLVEYCMIAAKSIARESARNRVLLVCTELCSLHMQLDDRIENLVASSLFADGSGGMVVGTSPRKGERPIFELHHSASHIIPNTLPMMSWELSKSGSLVECSFHTFLPYSPSSSSSSSLSK